MLRKLMKHEIRSTSRIMLPLFGVVLVLSLFVSIILRSGAMEHTTNPILNVFYAIIMASYGISLGATFIVVLLLMINRFRTNLLGDEGYVMFTLPVSVHQLIWSKILISCLWFVGTCIMVGLSAMIVAFDVSSFTQLRLFFLDIWQQMNAYYALNGTAILIESLLLFFFGYVACCLQFYSAMAVGYSFDRRKVLYSILVFFGFQFVMQMLTSMLFFTNGFDTWFDRIDMSVMTSVHTFFGVSIFGTIVYCAIFYLITTYFLQKRLNIE